MRQNKDPHKMSLNQAIGKAGKGELIYAPEGASKAQRLKVIIDAIKQGKMVFICADTPRKFDSGVPVKIFGRTAYFPSGVFTMSLRTGAPVVPVTWHWENGKYHIHYDNPIELPRGGNLKIKAAEAIQNWAQTVDAFLHKHPEMWWNWLDKRWTYIIRDDKRFMINSIQRVNENAGGHRNFNMAFSKNVTLKTGATLNVTSGELNLGGNTLTKSGTNTLTIGSSGLLRTSNSSGTTSGTDITTFTTYTLTGELVFNGNTGDETLPSGVTNDAFDLTVNKSSGGVVMGGAVSFGGDGNVLTLSNGSITTTAANTLTLLPGTSVSGGSGSSFLCRDGARKYSEREIRSAGAWAGVSN